MEVLADGYVIEVPADYVDTLSSYVTTDGAAPLGGLIRVVCRKSQMPYMPSKSLYEQHAYATDFAQSVRNYVPTWSRYEPGAPRAQPPRQASTSSVAG